MIDPNDFVITRRRKKYKFAQFANADNCFEIKDWLPSEGMYIELGAGSSLFTLELARRHPERTYIAVDVKADRLQSAARIAIDEGLSNIQFVRAHANQLLAALPDDSVRELWLTFSDPFPKNRHAKHRLTHPSFLNQYKRVLAEGASMKLKTDNQALFHWSLEQLTDNRWVFQELRFDLHESYEADDDRCIVTTFEQKFMAEDLPIYYFSASA